MLIRIVLEDDTIKWVNERIVMEINPIIKEDRKIYEIKHFNGSKTVIKYFEFVTININK